MKNCDDIKKLCDRYKKEPLIRISVIIFIIFIIIIGFFFLWDRNYNLNTIESDVFGQYGDFIGGVVGTFFAFISIVLVYETLSVSNKQLKIQENSVKEQQVENHFFELLKIHIENVNKIKKDYSNFFEDSIECMNIIYKIMRGITRHDDMGFNYHPHSNVVIAMSYLLFYYGSNKNNIKTIKSILAKFCKDYEYEYNEEAISDYLEHFNNKLRIEDLKTEKKLRQQCVLYIIDNNDKINLTNKEAILGNYFRHLYQTVIYINNSIIGFTKKYEYIKTLRAQLSSYEQLLLFWDSLSPIGYSWEWRYKRKKELNMVDTSVPKQTLITTFHLIKNIPAGYENEEIKPQSFYSKVNYDWL